MRHVYPRFQNATFRGLFFMNYFDKNAVYEFWKIHSSERNEKKLHQKLLNNFSMFHL